MTVRLTRRRLMRFSFAVAVVASSVGCSSPSPSSAPSATTEPVTTAAPTTSSTALTPTLNAGSALASPSACGLLTTNDVQGALTGTVASGSPTDAADGSESICDWTITRADGSGFGLQLDVHAGRSSADWTQQRLLDPTPTQTINGLGDDAFAQTISAGGQTYDDLWVRKGTINFRLEVLDDLGPRPLQPLAQTVLVHL